MQVASINTKDKLKFLFLCLNLFIIGLSIPTISTLLILLLPLFLVFLGYLRIPKYLLRSVSILISIVSLILFVIINYYQLYSYGIDSEKGAVYFFIEVVTIILLFLMGICLDFKKMPFFPFNLVALNLSLFSGGIIWVFLSVAQYNRWGFSLVSIVIPERKVPGFWKGSDLINGPSLDMYSYLGLSLIGLLIILSSLSPSIGKYGKPIFFTVIFILIFMSAYSSISLGARTPIIVFLVSVITTFVFTNFFKTGFQKSRSIMILFYSSIGCIFLLFRDVLSESLFELISSLLELNIGSRFISEGLETPRYMLWLEAIEQIPHYPWGGRLMIMSERYVHNIWLDQLYDAGILAMLFLLIFHLVQIPIFFKFFRLKLPVIIHVFTLCTLVAFLGAFVQAPVMQANYVYFAISCFFFASVGRLTLDFPRTKKQNS
jgi:hypothetical protein